MAPKYYQHHSCILYCFSVTGILTNNEVVFSSFSEWDCDSEKSQYKFAYKLSSLLGNRIEPSIPFTANTFRVIMMKRMMTALLVRKKKGPKCGEGESERRKAKKSGRSNPSLYLWVHFILSFFNLPPIVSSQERKIRFPPSFQLFSRFFRYL